MLQDTAIVVDPRLEFEFSNLLVHVLFQLCYKSPIVSVYCRLSRTSHVADWYP